MKLTLLKYLKSSASFIFSNVHSPEIPLFLLLLSPPNTKIIPLVVKKSFPSFWGNLPYNLKSHFFLATHDKHVTLCGQKFVAGKLSLFSNCDAHLVLSILCKWLSNWIKKYYSWSWCWLEVIMNGWIENVLMQLPRTKMTNLCTRRVVEHKFWIGPKIRMKNSVDAWYLLATDHLI